MRRWHKSGDTELHGQPVLVRADGAGASKEWLCHLAELGTDTGLDLNYSVGFTTSGKVRDAIGALPEAAWTPACNADGEHP